MANTSATSDNGYWVKTIVTAAPGYVIDPTSFTLVGGAGGSSNVRSSDIFDNVDGFPTSIAATAGTPTIKAATNSERYIQRCARQRGTRRHELVHDI